ncbi:ABC-2 type transport system ATP-binding protein [Alkalibacterium subtropicum]|uniref:ABC-2 type transport system ATP-binding protein n=1 Tax=Alkalibacterium subtropicum TaxID=753702 RepID=A0A1I1KJZ1_9LACT|nr:ATP-binding cassette domain-containing protein [Alkalibacterium subtropicum]SFC61186.1 ABC-2 type transport system ATP-binding protein [Alkalibacterium subtropicum]
MTLEVKNLTVAYGEREVLTDISFQIANSQIIGLVAPNGTGKTTLFNAIMRFVPVKSGHILVDDKEYTAKDKDVLKLHQLITFFPDQADLHENFSGTEHIEMYADMWAGKKDHVRDIIRRLEMDDYVDRKVSTYSLGMRQRLCFAMVIASDTPIMFMDEVMNGLDPENVSLVSDILIELRDEGKIIIVASHLLDNLDEYANKVFFLKDQQLHFVFDHSDETIDYFKLLCTEEQVAYLEAHVTLPEDTIHLGNNVLCIPLQELTEAEQLAIYKHLRHLKDVEITVGPMGTSEYYSHLYGLKIHSFNRGHQHEKPVSK